MISELGEGTMRYIIEIQLNTSAAFFRDGSEPATNFRIKEFTFNMATLDFDKRAGVRYYVSAEAEGDDRNEAYWDFMKRLSIVTDSIAYFYSQPVSIEYWNILIKKEGEEAAYLSAFKPRPATAMPDYGVIDSRLDILIDTARGSEELQNNLWIYNNVAKIDGVDYDPASHQFGLCQLVESLAEKREVPLCEACRKGGYLQTNRADIKSMLDDDLYKKLFGGSDILRNRLGHGNLIGATFLSNPDVEDVILKATERLNAKFDVSNKVSAGMTDRIRGTGVWNGTAYGIKHRNMGLEECLDIQFDDSRKHTHLSIPKTW